MFINSFKQLILPLSLCTFLEAESSCISNQSMEKEIKGCSIALLIKEDSRSLILNRLQEQSVQTVKESISKEQSIVALKKLVSSTSKLTLTKNEIALTKIDVGNPPLKSNNPSVIKRTNSFIAIKVKKGETLQSLAKQYYGDKKDYQLIYKHNKDKVGKNLQIFANTILLIEKGNNDI